MTITRGSCLCKTVRYELDGEPVKKVLCHCNNCRKATGSAFMANSFYLKSQIKVNQGAEALKAYQDSDLESGGTISRAFCNHCGSPLFTTNPRFPNIVIVTTGTMDEGRESWKPELEFFCKRRLAWVPEVEGTQKE